MTIDEIIDNSLKMRSLFPLEEKLYSNDSNYRISDGKLFISRETVHEIIKKLPIKILGVNNIHAEITDEGIVIKPNKV